MFGTEPNIALAYDMVSIASGVGLTTITKTEVELNLVDLETYWWRVNTTIGSGSDLCVVEGPLCSFTINDLFDNPIVSVDAGVDMVTWVDKPVDLDPNVIDDGMSNLTYLWTAAG